VKAAKACRFGAWAMQVVAVTAAASTVVGWVWGALLDAAGEPLMIVCLATAGAGMVAVLVVAATDPTAQRRWRPRNPPVTTFTGIRPDRRRAPWAIGLIAAISGAAGFVSTGGLSPDARNTQPGCQWSVGTDHGATERCVSHGRWLEVERGVEHGLLGMIAVFACIESGFFAAAAAHRQRMASRADRAELGS
jgi:hypothetical protein